MTHRTWAQVALGTALALSPLVAEAQRPRADRGADSGAQRGAAEARMRQRLGAMVKERLGLNDEQARKLAETSRRYEAQRRQLMMDERELRLQLRDEMAAGATPDQARVDRALGRMIALQRQRVDLLEREQKELAGFLTPVQRARYLAFQDEARRRVDEARRGGGRGQGAPRRGRPPAP
jgi:periplasmic protein CpxP/Spy